MTTHATLPSENPFATRYVRPGVVPYFFPQGETADEIVARLGQRRYGAIVGPHGSGKSTLLEALLPPLRATDWNPIVHVLHDGQRRLPKNFAAPTQADDLLVIDGYEQLGWRGRREVRRAVRRVAAGCLITAHAPQAGYPTLYTTRPTLEAARCVVGRLLQADPATFVSPEQLRRQFEQVGGDVRELLFQLYDLYESQRS